MLHSLWNDTLLWGGLRILSGFCNATLFMTMESWLSESSTSTNRGTIFGLYQFVTYLGLASGQMLINLSNPESPNLFIIASMLLCLCMIPILMSRSGGPRLTKQETMPFQRLYKVSPLGVVGCIVAGITFSAFYNMGSVYGAGVGLTTTQISLFMSAGMVGGLLLQFPVGKLSDQFDRRTVLVITLLFSCLLSMVLPLMAERHQFQIMLVCSGLIGGTLACIYPIALADAFDRLKTSEMVAASGSLILAYSMGGIIGPYSVSILMEALGPSALFGYLVSANLLLIGFVMYRMGKRAAVPEALQESFIIQGAAPIATQLDPRTAYNQQGSLSIAAETAVALAEVSPDNAVEIATNVALSQPEYGVEIAHAMGLYFPDQVQDLAQSMVQAMPEHYIDLLSGLAAASPTAAPLLGHMAAQHVLILSNSPIETEQKLIQLAHELVQNAPQKASDIVAAISQTTTNPTAEFVTKLAFLAAAAAPDQRIDVATAMADAAPDASLEVATTIAATIAASPEDELHTFLAQEADQTYPGEGAELAASIAQINPEQAVAIAAAVVEILPLEAANVADSVAQTNPTETRKLVDAINEVVPKLADKVVLADEAFAEPQRSVDKS
jgi:MFS family permease